MPTLQAQRAFLAKMLDVFYTGIITDAGDDWVKSERFSARNWHDDALVGAWLSVYPDSSAPDPLTPIIDDVEILGHDAKNNLLTLAMDGTSSATNRTFELFQRWSREELDFALMSVISDWKVINDIDLKSHERLQKLTGAAGQPGENLTQAEQVHRVWLLPIHRSSGGYDVVAARRFTQYELIEDGDALYIDNRDHLWENYWYEMGTLRVEYQNRYPVLHDGQKPLNAATFGGDMMNIALRAKAQLYNRKLQTATGANFDHMAQLYRDTLETIDQVDDSPDRLPSTSAITTRWI